MDKIERPAQFVVNQRVQLGPPDLLGRTAHVFGDETKGDMRPDFLPRDLVLAGQEDSAQYLMAADETIQGGFQRANIQHSAAM